MQTVKHYLNLIHVSTLQTTTGNLRSETLTLFRLSYSHLLNQNPDALDVLHIIAMDISSLLPNMYLKVFNYLSI